MRNRLVLRWLAKVTCPSLALLMVGVGCATVDPKPDYNRTRTLIEQSTGVAESYNPEEDGLTADELNAWLSNGLTLDEAVHIALLNNRKLQAVFLDIGMARADWVQSGLLSNPSLGIGVMFPEGGGRSNIQGNLAQNIVDLWQMPVKKRIAEHQVEGQVVRVARLAGELAAETKRAYYAAVAANDLLTIADENLALLGKSHDAIRAQREAGVASPLDENLQRGELLRAELDLRDARLDSVNAKRSLAGLLSLDLNTDELDLTDRLPESEEHAFDADSLIAIAREKRLDLKALEEAVGAGDAEIKLEYLRVFPEFSIGIAAERTEGRSQPGRDVAADFARASLRSGELTIPDIQTRGERQAEKDQDIEFMIGPNLSVTLPFFDQNRAQIAKATYAQVQAVKSYEDLYLGVAQDIRMAVDQSKTLWGNVTFYRGELLPQADRNLEFTQAAYQAGTVGVLTLLESQRSLLDTRRGYVQVWATAATSLSDLERAVGLPLNDVEAAGTQEEGEQSNDEGGPS
ncbi:MAG: TolC family protein [Phycisphaerales bacterium]|nr:MAG: TolC family protein [Phycisphaerales bacterium]